MAEQDIRVGIQADTNFPTVVNKVVRSVSTLQDNLDDLVGVLEDMAKFTGRAESSMGSMGSTAKKTVSEVDKLRAALQKTGKDGDEAIKQLDFRKINLKSLSAAEIEQFSKKLKEAGSSLGEFFQGQKVDLSFRPAIEELNQLQKLLNKPLSQPETFSSSKEVFAELRTLNQQLRTEIAETMQELRVPESAFSSVGELRSELAKLNESPATSSMGLFADLNENRAQAAILVDSIDEIRKKMLEIGPAAESGNSQAIEEFRQLSSQLDIATQRAEEFTRRLRGGQQQFQNITGATNESLSSLGFRQIRIDDIFPSEEQRKVDDIRRRIDTAVRESVQAGAVRDTLNSFLRKGAPAVGELDKNVVALTSHLPRLRYALYDVSNTVGIFGGALTAASLGVFKLATDVERQFADVARTTGVVGSEADRLKEDLLSLSQEIPVAFGDIAEIATLAGQLNIATENVQEFTDSVAKFSATTDVTIEAAATAFGRLDQLVEGVNGQFEKLGSSILAVGVNAVATESDIIAISSQIASVANIAGFSAGELIGFSSALASVGTRPELARGTFTRLFTEIQQSVAAGDEQLAAFARTAGQSSDEFSAAWGAGSGADQVIAILEGLNAAGNQADQVLAQLGITSVRDVPTLLKLAQSIDEVKKQIQIANIGFLEGNELQNQYSVITSTVSEKLVVLGNNFNALVQTLGEVSGYFGFVIDAAIAFIKALERILDNPVNQFIAGLGVTILGVIGILSLITAGLARAAGSITGFATASIEAREAVGLMKVSVDSLNGSLVTNASVTKASTAASKASTAASKAHTTAVGAEVIAVSASTAANAGLFKAFGRGLTQTKLFSGSLKGLAITVGLLLTFELVDWVYENGKAMGWWGDQTENLTDKLGELGPYMDAVRKDTEAFNNGTLDATKGLVLFQGEVDSGNTELSDRGKLLAVVTGQEDLLKESIDGTTTAINNQTLAIGENTLSLIKQKVAQELLNKSQEKAYDPRRIRELLATQEVARSSAAGGTVGYTSGAISQARTTIQQEGGGAGLASLFQIVTDPELNNRLIESGFNFKEWSDAVSQGNVEVANSITSQLGPAATQLADILDAEDPEAYADAIVYLRGAAAFGAQGLGEFTSAGSDLQEAIKALVFEQTILGDAWTESSEAAEDFRDALRSVVDDAYAQINAQAAAESAVRALGAAFAENSAEVVVNSQEMQSAIKAVIDTASSPEEAISALSGFYTAIVDGGYASGEQLEILQDIIKQTYADFVGVSLEALKIQRAALGAASSDRALYNRLGVEVPQSIKNAQKGAADLDRQIAALEGSVKNFAIGTGKAAEYAGDLATGYDEAQQKAAGTAKAAKDVAKETKEATREVRTLLDYASDLEKVFSRAFDIRFGAQSALDQITAGWESFAENVNDAKNALEELKASQEDLASDLAIKEYFLSVAEAYGDTLRATQLRQEISELEKKRLQQQAELEKAQSRTEGATALTGDAEQARDNRAALTGLVKNYQDYIKVLAESGASQDELRRATEEARQQFIQQAKELGFQEDVVLQYAKAFDDVQTAIANVERNITVEANVDPALQALNELRASLQSTIDKADELTEALGQEPKKRDPKPDSNADAKAEIRANIARLEAASQRARVQPGGGSDVRLYNMAIDKQKRALAKLYTGGYTGAGGKFQPAGIVHRGEYVVPKHHVDQSTRLPSAAFLAQMQNATRGYAQGGFVGGMGGGEAMMVELSPYDRKLLADAGNVQLRLNGRVVAEATNASNYNEARRGSN